MLERSLGESEVWEFHELFIELLSMEGKYAVILSITDLFKFNSKWRKRYNGRLWKMQMWSDSYLKNGPFRHKMHENVVWAMCEVVFAAFEVAIDLITIESLFTDNAASKSVIKSN